MTSNWASSKFATLSFAVKTLRHNERAPNIAVPTKGLFSAHSLSLSFPAPKDSILRLPNFERTKAFLICSFVKTQLPFSSITPFLMSL